MPISHYSHLAIPDSCAAGALQLCTTMTPMREGSMMTDPKLSMDLPRWRIRCWAHRTGIPGLLRKLSVATQTKNCNSRLSTTSYKALTPQLNISFHKEVLLILTSPTFPSQPSCIMTRRPVTSLYRMLITQRPPEESTVGSKMRL